MDVHVPSEVTDRLRNAGVDVLTAQEAGRDRQPDEVLLEWGEESQWAIFTNDVDFLILASARQHAGQSFGCVFYADQNTQRSREYAQWLETYAKLEDWDTMRNRVTFIPG
jgi:predicted nuclease of predicted toxin-antitoxin system